MKDTILIENQGILQYQLLILYLFNGAHTLLVIFYSLLSLSPFSTTLFESVVCLEKTLQC